MIALLLVSPLLAQDLRFPIGDAHIGYAYPTAYKDHGGVDWNCGSLRYGGHNGNDFGIGSWSGMDAGRDIVAAAEGTVVYAHDGEYDRCSTGDCYGGSGFGNYVKVQHADGKVAYYAHMRQWTVAVSAGQWVSCGTFLGQVGSSGYSTGPHIHFEVRNSGNTAEDPFDGACSAPPSYWVDQGSYGSVPSPACDGPVEPCAPVDLVTCGADIRTRNDAAGSTASHFWYGCTEYTYSGRELAWRFVTDRDERVTVSLGGLSADLDLFVLGSAACDGGDCIGASISPYASSEAVGFDARAAQEVVIVVDGWEGAASDFQLQVSCGGTFPGGGGTTPTDPGGTTSTDPGTSTSTDPGTVPTQPDDEALTEAWSRQPLGPAGCGASPGSGLAAWVAFLILGRRRRA